jgi:cell division protein FtsB
MKLEKQNQNSSKGLRIDTHDLENGISNDEKSEIMNEFENEPENLKHIQMNKTDVDTLSSNNVYDGKHIKDNTPPSSPSPKSSTASCDISKEVSFDANGPLWKKRRNAQDSVDTKLRLENMKVVIPYHDKKGSNTNGSHYTEATTPMTVSSTPTNIYINQEPSGREAKSKSKSAGETITRGVFNYRKPIFLFLLAYSTMATGAGAYMLRQLFRIPGLDSQIDELRTQNERLKGQIDRLEGQNEVLKLNIDRLEVSNVELKESNIVFQGLVSDLHQLNEEVSQINVVLIDQNKLYRENNEALRESNIFLNSQVNETSLIAANLTAQVALYDNLILEMENEVNKTAIIAADLDVLAQNLTSQIIIFEKENDRLSNLTDNLITVVSFLNNTSGDIAETYEALSEHIAEKIIAYRTIRMNNHKIFYKQLITDWDCAVLTRFRLRDFSYDYTTPIGEESIDDVLAYVDGRVLSDVCADRDDFENFLSSTILQSDEQLSDLTMADLETGVSMYTTELLNFYFPGQGQANGLIESDWSQAGYDCNKLVKKFFY